MSNKPYFCFLEDGKSLPPYPNESDSLSGSFCKEAIDKARLAAIERIGLLKGASERAAERIAACQRGFFVGKAEKDEAYDTICRFFLEVEDSKHVLSTEAIKLAHIAERLADEIGKTGEVDTERTKCERDAEWICDKLIVFCTQTVEQICDSIDRVADTEHECGGVRIGETVRILGGFSEALAALHVLIKEN